MQYIAFDEVIAEAITAIGADGSDEIAKQFARTWAYRALQSLGDSEEIIAVERMYPKNLLLRKPKNFKKLLDIALYDSNGCLIPHQFHTGKKRIYPQTDGVLYIDSEGEETFIGPVDVSEDTQNFVLGTNGTCVAYADVRFWQYPLDGDGLPIVREDEVEAISAYIRLRWSQRQNNNQSEIQANRMDWMRLADICKAAKKSINNEQAKTIAAQMNRMIPNFNRSKF